MRSVWEAISRCSQGLNGVQGTLSQQAYVVMPLSAANVLLMMPQLEPSRQQVQ